MEFAFRASHRNQSSDCDDDLTDSDIDDLDDSDGDDSLLDDQLDVDQEDQTCVQASPGFRVIRGPDWIYKNQDGGFGHAGTVVDFSTSNCQRPWSPHDTTLVRWDNGNKGLYRTGHKRAFDLRVFNTSCASMVHWRVWCDACDREDIAGIRWRCTQCFAFDLCTDCYMGGEHDLDHVFMRVNSSDTSSLGPRMLPRSSSCHVTILGIFPGARVVDFAGWFQRKRGSASGRVASLHSWRVGDEDREEGRVEVDFGNAVRTRSCGYQEGAVELSSTIPGRGGDYYIGHLPKLGYNDRINVGDAVVIGASREEFVEFQQRHGLWNASMTNLSCKEGVVIEKLDLGDVMVEIEDTEETYPINPSALQKRYSFCPGQNVMINGDEEMIKRLQRGHGGWTAEMKKISLFGRVIEVDGRDVKVKIDDKKTYILNGACLEPNMITPHDRPKAPSITPKQRKKALRRLMTEPIIRAAISNDAASLKSILEREPHLAHYEVLEGLSLVGLAAEKCEVGVLRALIEKGAFVESMDSNGMTSLMKAVSCNKYENVEYLLEKGANVNAVGAGGLRSFDIAVQEGYPRCAELLLQHGVDVNMRGCIHGRPVLLDVAAKHQKSKSIAILDMMLEHTDTDLKLVDEEWESALHLAVMANRERSVQKLVEKVPRLADARTLRGTSPLMLAAENNALPVAEILLKKGRCDIDATDRSDGETAVAMATARLNLNVLELLVKHGADLNVRNKAGNTALQIAINLRHARFVRVPDHPILKEMKDKWGCQRILTNADALAAYLVWNGAELDVLNCHNVSIRSHLRATRDTLGPALSAIQRLRREMVSAKPNNRQKVGMPRARRERSREKARKKTNAYFRQNNSKDGPRDADPKTSLPEDDSPEAKKGTIRPGKKRHPRPLPGNYESSF